MSNTDRPYYSGVRADDVSEVRGEAPAQDSHTMAAEAIQTAAEISGDRTEASPVAVSDPSIPLEHDGNEGMGDVGDEQEQIRLQCMEEQAARENGDQETLFAQTASDLETRLTERIGALTERVNALMERLEELETHPAPVERQPQVGEACSEDGPARSMYRQAWQAAPLTLRLKFVADLLPDSHPLQSVLKEAGALEELRRRGRDLESWLTNYPALFADAAQVLETGAQTYAAKFPDEAAHDADVLAAHTLYEARQALETTLQALGVMWIAPLPGEAVTLEHEVIGEEASEQPEGSVARLRRRGFRAQGRLALPAQIMRSISPVNDARTLLSATVAEMVENKTRNISSLNDARTSAIDAEATEDGTDTGNSVNDTAGALAADRRPADNASTQSVTSPFAQAADSQEKQAANTAEATVQTAVKETSPDAVSPMRAENDTQAASSDLAQGQRESEPQTIAETVPAWQAGSDGISRGEIQPEAAASGREISPFSGELTDWQRLLVQQTFRCDVSAVSLLVKKILALNDLPGQVAGASADEAQRILIDALLPLLPVLGLRYADGLPDVPPAWGQILLDVRSPLLAWLETHLDVRLISPQRGLAFDARTMEAWETRRTVHADENETVARSERVGLLWKSASLLRAQVVRYAAGGNP